MIRPYVQLKAALSLDGYIDDASEERRVFSSPEDQAAVDELRADFDAILIGAATLRKDNPRLAVRAPELQHRRLAAGKTAEPIKAVLTKSGELPLESRFFQDGTGLKLVYCAEKTAARLSGRLGGLAEVIPLPKNQDSLRVVFEDMKRRGINRLLVEGGSAVLSLFLAANAADGIRLAYAPAFLGQTAGPKLLPKPLPQSTKPDPKLCSVRNVGGTLVLDYRF